jgi:hypothetical protein
MISKDTRVKTSTERVKYRSIRLREEVALQLDEWRELFDDSSMSEAMWRVFALARRELKRVSDKKKKTREQFVKSRKLKSPVVDTSQGSVVGSGGSLANENGTTNQATIQKPPLV